MKKRIAAAIATTLAIGLVVAPAAMATKSKVSIYYHTGSQWVGDVTSSKTSCENKRTVTLFLKFPGEDNKIGKDKTKPAKGDTYAWFIPHEAPAPGDYYAKVAPKGNCGGDKSKAFNYPNDQPPRKAGAKTTVTIEDASAGAGSLFVRGKVKSPDKDCANKRKVTLYLEKPGKDEKVDTVKSRHGEDSRFEWEARDPMPYGGVYYAKVEPGGGCDGDKSKDFPVEGKAAKKPDTKVQIGGYAYNGAGQGQNFQVEVISKKLKCKKKRKVTLFHEGDGKIGSSKAISGEGTWVAVIDVPDDPETGAYYASVSKEDGCDKARTEDFFSPFT